MTSQNIQTGDRQYQKLKGKDGGRNGSVHGGEKQVAKKYQNGVTFDKTLMQNGGTHFDIPRVTSEFANGIAEREETHRIENGTITEIQSVQNGVGQSSFSQLSYEQMFELQRVADKRVKSKLSEGLSPEGRKAMEFAKAEREHLRKKEKNTLKKSKVTVMDTTISEFQNQNRKGKGKKQLTFADAYEKTSASRLSGDFLDEHYKQGNQKRRALGGGNIHVAMETVEIVSYGETQSDSEVDDIAIEETAKLNSVDKCLVWMEVHSQDGDDEQR